MSAAHILVVDDEPEIRNLVREILEDEGYEVSVAADAREAREARRRRAPDLVLLDIWMPDVDGITLLREWCEGGAPPCPVVMMSGHGTVETAVEATRLGAFDYVEKPLSLHKLLAVVERALAGTGARPEGTAPAVVTEPVGRSLAMQRLREQARRAAATDSPVVIVGEPGSGKETLARYMHQEGTRRGGPFVVVPAASLHDEAAAALLFGRERDGRVEAGRLEAARGGVLYIDELTAMAPDVQARLAAALDAGGYQRVGGTATVPLDTRIVAATTHEPEDAAREGRLRAELLYRLGVVVLRVPPLREHREDVPELLAWYADYFADREGLPYRRFTVAAQNRLRHHAWPGNVRELRNLVQRVLILGSGEEIDLEEVERALREGGASGAGISAGPAAWFDLPLREARERFERAYLEHQLAACGGSVGKLAQRVGMERTHLYRKLRSLGIDPKKAAVE